MKPITYKQVLDGEGYLEALEIHQGDQSITISLSESMKDGDANYRWHEIKKTIDRIQKSAADTTYKALRES